jgi:hypothetical protein
MKNKRIIVRVVIGLLLTVMVIEGISYGRVFAIHRQLSSLLQKAETENYQINRKKIDEILNNQQPSLSKTVKVPVGDERYDVYQFWGLLKQRQLCVHYGVAGRQSEPEVIEITSIIPDEVLAN